MTHIPLEKCKHGHLYRIHSRNLELGVFNERTKGFVGIREKFWKLYLFTEYHADTGAPFGTVHPLEEIEECPVKNVRELTEKRDTSGGYEENAELFAYLARHKIEKLESYSGEKLKNLIIAADALYRRVYALQVGLSNCEEMKRYDAVRKEWIGDHKCDRTTVYSTSNAVIESGYLCYVCYRVFSEEQYEMLT
jgi:hypothetical protein